MLKEDSVRLGGRIYAIATFNYMRLLYSLEMYSKQSPKALEENEEEWWGGKKITLKYILILKINMYAT